MTISAKGTLLERIEKGATVNLEVKWGLITLIKQTVDLCDELENVDMECPLEKGEMILTKEVELPKQIPPVRFLYNRSRAKQAANVFITGQILRSCRCLQQGPGAGHLPQGR